MLVLKERVTKESAFVIENELDQKIFEINPRIGFKEALVVDEPASLVFSSQPTTELCCLVLRKVLAAPCSP